LTIILLQKQSRKCIPQIEKVETYEALNCYMLNYLYSRGFASCKFLQSGGAIWVGGTSYIFRKKTSSCNLLQLIFMIPHSALLTLYPSPSNSTHWGPACNMTEPAQDVVILIIIIIIIISDSIVPVRTLAASYGRFRNLF
jgi:hypothetical protein